MFVHHMQPKSCQFHLTRTHQEMR